MALSMVQWLPVPCLLHTQKILTDKLLQCLGPAQVPGTSANKSIWQAVKTKRLIQGNKHKTYTVCSVSQHNWPQCAIEDRSE